MPNGEGKVFLLRWEHIIVTIVTALLALGALYGTMTTRMSYYEEHQHQLDQSTVKHEEFDEMREDIKTRLTRIEKKIDQENSMRSLNDEYLPKRPRH